MLFILLYSSYASYVYNRLNIIQYFAYEMQAENAKEKSFLLVVNEFADQAPEEL